MKACTPGMVSAHTAVEEVVSTPKSEPYLEVAEVRSEFHRGAGGEGRV